MDDKELLWQKLSDEVTRRGGSGDEVVEAYRELYAVHDEEKIASWLGSLFDSDIGGFYYSNSAKNNEYGEFDGQRQYFLPDIESTNQAVNFLTSTGMIKSSSQLPEWMRKKIIAFVCSLQDSEDGFIYHPQWGRDIKPSKRGRDLMWATSLEKNLGFSLPYPTANDRLKSSLSSSDKRDESASVIPECFRSREKYLEYLSSLEWEENSYRAGNAIAAQTAQIVAAGLTDTTVDFLDSIQNKDTGIWGNKKSYEAVNGILKVTCFYEGARKPIPNPMATAMTAMDCISEERECETVCWQFNAWFSVGNIVNNLRAFGGEDGCKTADRIALEMLKRAPAGIRSSAKKVRAFLCDDGNYSYFPDRSQPWCQGSRISLGLKEGDVNATTLNCTGVIRRSLMALELGHLYVPVFGEEGYEKFLSALKKPIS